MDKNERKILDELRHSAHMLGDLRDLRDLITRTEKFFSGRTAIVEKRKDEVITHSVDEFCEKRRALGTALIDMGLKDKNIAILSEGSFNWVLAFMTIACGVGTAVPLDKELSDSELSVLLTKADAEAVFFSRPYISTVELHAENDSNCKYSILMTKMKKEHNFLDIDALIEKGRELLKNGDTRYLDAEIDPDKPCAIVFTSGTTGANKGVLLSHTNFVANVDNIIETIPTEYSSFSLLPMNHVFELSCNIFTALYMNAVIYINDSLKNILQNIQLFEPDAMNAVPLVLEGIYNGIWAAAEKKGKAEALKKLVKISNKLRTKGIDLRHVLFKTISKNFGGKFPTLVCGGAPSRAEYVTGLGDFGFKVYNGYGLTESSPSVALNMAADKNPLSAGFCLPRCEMKIHEPDADGIGEIWIRGKNVTCGYYKDGQATADSFEDGWFKTGDYGIITAEGELFVSGRKKTLIILDNGKNIFPEDVEFSVMDNISYIRECCAFEAVKTIAEKTQTIIAVGVYVEKADFPGMSEAEIVEKVKKDITEVNKKMPSYKKVSDFFVVYEEFEKTSTRKIIRAKVSDAYKALATK